MEQGYKVISSICQNSSKMQQKIKNKQFLLGKFYDFKNLTKKKTKPTCFCKSKTKKLLDIQMKIIPNLEQDTYMYFQPLHKLWMGYMKDLIQQQKNQQSTHLKIIRSDFHGSFISVVYSKVESCIGIEGIVIKQTLKTFVIVTKQNRFLTLVKQPHVFMLTINERNFIINGNGIMYRPSDRIKHKFKFKKAEKLNQQFLTGFLFKQQQEFPDIQMVIE